jgi:hypothetical protein
MPQTPLNQRGPADSATPSPGWRLRPTPLSRAGVPGEVSRQRVASCFPIASHCWWAAQGHEEGKEHAYAEALLS